MGLRKYTAIKCCSIIFLRCSRACRSESNELRKMMMSRSYAMKYSYPLRGTAFCQQGTNKASTEMFRFDFGRKSSKQVSCEAYRTICALVPSPFSSICCESARVSSLLPREYLRHMSLAGSFNSKIRPDQKEEFSLHGRDSITPSVTRLFSVVGNDDINGDSFEENFSDSIGKEDTKGIPPSNDKDSNRAFVSNMLRSIMERSDLTIASKNGLSGITNDDDLNFYSTPAKKDCYQKEQTLDDDMDDRRLNEKATPSFTREEGTNTRFEAVASSSLNTTISTATKDIKIFNEQNEQKSYDTGTSVSSLLKSVITSSSNNISNKKIGELNFPNETLTKSVGQCISEILENSASGSINNDILPAHKEEAEKQNLQRLDVQKGITSLLESVIALSSQELDNQDRNITEQKEIHSSIDQDKVNFLLKKSLTLASNTLSSRETIDSISETSKNRSNANIINFQCNSNSSSTIDDNQNRDSTANSRSNSFQNIQQQQYLTNPCVTGTAMAHSLWSTVLQPGLDSAIDATCGNGKDSLAIAKLLFAPPGDNDKKFVASKLICIDIQQSATSSTKTLLEDEFGTSFVRSHVDILHASHDPLPYPDITATSNVALVVYNLGYLPGCSSSKDICTRAPTTISSLADAALLIRIGGLISVMTYPGTDYVEAQSVRMFMEGLAMLTTNEPGGWESYIDNTVIASGAFYDVENTTDIEAYCVQAKECTKDAVRLVHQEGSVQQTWRVFEHSPLGRPLSPVLITAYRVK